MFPKWHIGGGGVVSGVWVEGVQPSGVPDTASPRTQGLDLPLVPAPPGLSGTFGSHRPGLEVLWGTHAREGIGHWVGG